MSKLAIALIQFYQKAVSPLRSPACRFIPSCSEYALEAFSRYGFFRGAGMTLVRLGRCHPFSKGGFAPVP